jgi:hypothetical protein
VFFFEAFLLHHEITLENGYGSELGTIHDEQRLDNKRNRRTMCASIASHT